jgi:predicted transcriptional regulator
MKKNIKIEIKNEKESAHDFIDAWHTAEKGKSSKTPINRICFQNLETLLSTLTPRLDLLKVLHDKGNMSIRALATTLKKDYKNVYQDTKILENIELVVKTGRLFSVPWKSIVAAVKLAA